MFDWLFGKPRFRFYEDSYARTRASAVAGIQSAIEGRADCDDVFLIVAHFPDRFEEIQSALHSWKWNYEILHKSVSPEGVARYFSNPKQRILLALSSLLDFQDQVQTELDEAKKICVIGVERHPHVQYDESLEKFCRAIPTNVELGYFLSFEDAIIKSLVNEASIKILDLFGMGENELITSNMITRRLKTVLNQNAKNYIGDVEADSADQWLLLNSPDTNQADAGS